ncbi:hypothetical protein [Streptomyces sp. T028]|uniref:hypothetical protein n=1 Tax=Streptomyces sp. T028 TaxID=3394379 RepID=UPI003A843D06
MTASPAEPGSSGSWAMVFDYGTGSCQGSAAGVERILPVLSACHDHGIEDARASWVNVAPETESAGSPPGPYAAQAAVPMATSRSRARPG